MIRTTVTAACAAVALAAMSAMSAAPALAAEAITLKLGGLSTPATFAAVTRAAHKVCRPEHGAEIYAIFVTDDCVRDTIDATVAKIGDPALVQFAADRETLLLSLATD